MGFFRGVRKVAGAIVDVRVDKWVSYTYLKETNQKLYQSIRSLFIPQKAERTETFEQAMQRLQLTEQDLKERQKEFIRLVLTFVTLALGLLAYGVYWAFEGGLAATLISFCLCGFCFVQAFRFHFWYFQIKHRKLGCTIEEWYNSQTTDKAQ